jgi:CheY-like chemotaxis protein
VAGIPNAKRGGPAATEAEAVVQCTFRVRTPLPVLLVEDSDEDYAALVRALDEMPAIAAFHRCTRGDEALDFLHGRGRFGEPPRAPRPALILLDLNLPGKDGRALLTEIRSDERLRSIPVVIVTTSRHRRDVDWCYRNGANGYHVKAFDYPRFRDEMRLLVAYWLNACVLPANVEERNGGAC